MIDDILFTFFQLSQFNNLKDSKTLEELERTKSGLCGIQSEWFVEECKKKGREAVRLTIPNIPNPNAPYPIGGHSTAAVKIEKRWIFFDCSNGCVFFSHDFSYFLSWPEIVDHTRKYDEVPTILQLPKDMYDTPNSSNSRQLSKCVSCGEQGIIEDYYNTKNIKASNEYYHQDAGTGKWKVLDAQTDIYVRDLSTSEVFKIEEEI